MSYQPPEQPGQPYPYQQQPPYQPYGPPPNSSKATTSLVLGIVSLVACGLFLGIPAMIVGRQAKREIQDSGGRLGGEGLATAGFVTGLIATILSVLGILVLAALLIFGLALGHAAETCSSSTDANGNTTVHCGNS